MSTLKNFLANTNIPESLVHAVVEQMSGWSEFKRHALDVANNGASGGFSGFYYYFETVPFVAANKTAIVEMATQQAFDLYGDGSPFTMIAEFRVCALRPEEVAEALYNPESENRAELFNLLAFYSLEEVARAYIDFCEQD